MSPEPPFLRNVILVRERIENPNVYPFLLPAVQALDGLALSAVTYFVGENGSGKSTILEALALVSGFNAEGGTINFKFATRRSESPLHQCIRLARAPRRPRTGFFLRAESFFNLATEIERLDAEPSSAPRLIDSYGGRSLHEQSHGESFLALMKHRFGPNGLYILDEPEAALSPSRQLSLLIRMHDLLERGSQFIIATHSPIVLAYPGATIYHLDQRGINSVEYDQMEHVQLTRDFLNDRGRFLKRLLSSNSGETDV
jgi:predicted ATPase